MRWQWIARLVAASVALGCAGIIFYYTRSQPAPEQPLTTLPNPDPNVVTEMKTGRTKWLRPGRSDVDLNYVKSEEFADGTWRYSDVTIAGLEESRFTLTAGTMIARRREKSDTQPTFFEFSDRVVLVVDDGLRLESANAVYDDQTRLLNVPDVVQFSRGRMAGRAVGATYDLERDVIELLKEATARVAAGKDGKGAADATSDTMVLVRGQKMLKMEGHAQIVGEASTMSAQNATIVFTEDETAMKYLELRSAAQINPNPGKAGAGQTAMRGENITMAFYPDGVTPQHATVTGMASVKLAGAASRSITASWIDMFLGEDGKLLTGLAARDKVVVDLAAGDGNPRRVVTAASLTSTGNKTGLTEARFDGKPRFTQDAGDLGGGKKAEARSGHADRLVLTLGGKLDAIERADFQQHAVFTDGDTQGSADRIVYDEKRGELRLTQNPAEPRTVPRVKSPDIQVDGLTITVDTNNENITAVESVTTRVEGKKGSEAGSRASLFDSTQPITGSGQAFEYSSATGAAVYKGGPKTLATLRQGQSEVKAPWLRFIESSRNLEANGGVDSTWLLEPTEGSKGRPVKPHRVTAESLMYDDAKRLLVYSGGQVMVTTPDGTIEADRAEFTLSATSRALETLKASASKPGAFRVYSKLPGGERAAGDVLTYDAANERHVLEGKPARVLSTPGKDAKPDASGVISCALQEGWRITVVKGVIEEVKTDDKTPHGVQRVPCDYDIRRIR